MPADAWHARPTADVLAALGTTDLGLSTEVAARRLVEHGPNALPQHGGESALSILVRQFHNPLIYVLLASTGLAILTGKVFDGLVILGVVVLNAIIGFVQEYRAGKAIQALSAMVPQLATVLRDGRRQSLPAADLVPGDVVALQSGDKVPADVRLLEARTLKVEEAALTGESVPVEKGPAPVDADAGVGDRRSMGYSGTLVTYGTGTAVVVGTGARTELGRISALLKEADDLETPLTKQLGVIGTWITAGIVAVSVVLLAVGLLRGYPLGDAVLAAVTLAVGAIPEGLPAVVTIALAIGVQRMARRRSVVRKLPAVETLGSTTVICSDKTGTLTKNEMTVQALWTPAGAWRLTGVGYAPEGALVTDDGVAVPGPVPDAVRALLTAGALCNDATVERQGDAWALTGDPTEGALVTAADKLGLEAEALRVSHPRLDAVPFESERQYMATLHREPGGGQAIYVKGAPEAVLRRCALPEGGAERAAVLAEVERIAAQGMRVLACGVRRPGGSHAELAESDVEAGFTFLGLQGMIDPPRAEAVEAVRACRAAGITVKMITGDHPETARAIGEALGLADPGEEAVTGAELGRLSDEALREAAARHNVFARVAPEHKLRLVQALQARGEVVAMTGDGVNDAPALKQADIGVAMGITGTAVSKEAADVVLADDNFASIAAAVEEGRRVYDNLIKALAFLLPTNLGLAVILSVAVAFFPIVGGEALLPMLPVQILWINLVASVALALPLAFEAPERDVMRRPPRRPDAPILSRFVVGRTVAVALLMAAGAIGLFLNEYREALAAGVEAAAALGEAQTMAVTTVILFQIFYLLNCRSLKESVLQIGLFSNPWVYVGIGSLLVLQLGFVYLPVMHAVFGSAPIPAHAWGEALVVALVVIPAIGLEKWWRRRRAGA
ncbi:cation transporter [Rubrivirga marina]|uniref:Cation transporter n=1 Tax=Rubrivirga marina TaxID=1196024 RepID=A0A271J6T6_9BACT|nr:cation transporter [Rubrivirga marina]